MCAGGRGSVSPARGIRYNICWDGNCRATCIRRCAGVCRWLGGACRLRADGQSVQAQADLYDCIDSRIREVAQDVFDQNRGDPYGLDEDGSKEKTSSMISK